MKFLTRFVKGIFNTRAAGVYMLLFAISIGVATFVENDFGTSSAQKIIFKSWWFELLLLLFGITILVNIIKFRMIQQKKWALFMFHFSIIIILIGAGVTRYYGFEGIMHIRENSQSNVYLSSESYLNFKVSKNGQSYHFDEPVLFATLGNNKWHRSYNVANDIIDIDVLKFIPNPKQILEDSPDGVPTLKVVFGTASGREEYFIKKGDKRIIKNVNFNFTDFEYPSAINILYRNDSLLISSDQVLVQTVMATRAIDTLYPTSNYYPLKLRSLYEFRNSGFVFGSFNPSGKVSLESSGAKVKGESMTALVIQTKINGEPKETTVFGKKGLPGRGSKIIFNDVELEISYGAKEKQLPFSIKLYDFIMDKYPGTNSASSYASEVQLIDDRVNLKKDYRIYMNNILDHGGYRFFQSSFDPDEQGTYLSVNHDFWGTWISYIGYIFLTLGMILSLFSKKSRFHYVSKQIKKLRSQSAVISFLLIFSFIGSTSFAQISDHQIIDPSHADKFAHLIVQDNKGRMKPMHTLTREVMRKLMRKEGFEGLNADQVVLGMLVQSHEWQNIKLVKLGKHEDIKKLLGINGNLGAYNDFFSKNGQYKLRDEIRRAYGLQPIDRGVFEKELMKLDEKINIISMVFSGRIFKIIPTPNDKNNTWASSRPDHDKPNATNPIADKFFGAYIQAVRKALETKDYSFSNKILDELSEYQQTIGADVVPSDTKLSAEILLNEMYVFGRLAILYILLGMVFLVFLFLSVFKPEWNLSKIYKILFWLVVIAFTFHTIGLGLRWYISGRAPWSNGYESMIYIAWTSTLAGLLFTRRSLGGLAATMVLAATVLLVAELSYLDPEITPLVPVLKSYWLTIHVSLEAGSYGFLMLGAIIGLINLILMIFITEQNKIKIHRMIKEMSFISEMTLICGLFMVSIGTYLGGVWANESWGRYWGWDAKETWALVTILVYAFILHMRIIPKMNGLFMYNLATIFGWASVIMTYYGVNYYLSGLHSYASGDPIPIPNWVYIVIAVVIFIALLAYRKKRKFKIIS